jgi:hypothetical protein
MPPVAFVLTAAALASTPAIDMQVPASRLFPRTLVCGAQFDPHFVRFAPPARTSGKNPLLRLVAGPGPGDIDARTAWGGGQGCVRMLTRGDLRP